ncbi:hypothetical protein [Promicromonospora iranensis]|uniref:Uncharacterized protein n=1 Tax=Promicromonospora iranensis TaxID=1105144 RepID=A0ABU2CV88_9MICO|nr:hypothetical protein [Promicromonospora iranensis]MDR7385201.1 hypothetical protein [Promicromonospora iranensis]
MLPYRIDQAQVKDIATGNLRPELVGHELQIVVRDTTTPFPIYDETEAVIPDSIVIVTPNIATPTVWIDTDTPADLYLDWYDISSGTRGPVNFEAVLRDSAQNAATSAEASATSASTSAAASTAAASDVGALRQWVDLGITTRNCVPDPRATTGAFWMRATGGAATETMVTGATDGPVLPDGTRVTTYARYVIESVSTGNVTFGTANFTVPLVLSGKSVALAIYVRSSAAVPSISVRKDSYLDGVAAGGAQGALSSSLAANAWERRSGVVTNHADFNEIRVAAQFPAGSQSVGQVIDVTCALVSIDQAAVPDHFDGDSPSTTYVGNRWVGTPNASVSEHIEMKFVRSVNGEGPDASGNVVIPTSGTGVSKHGDLSGLGNDDHPQYLTQARGDMRYYQRAAVDTAIATSAASTLQKARDRAGHYGAQPISSITGLQAELDELANGGGGGNILLLNETDPVPVSTPAWTLVARSAGTPPPEPVTAAQVVTSTMTSARGEGGTAALAVPAGTVVGDLLVAVVTTSITGGAITPPAGWVTLQRLSTFGDYRATGIYGFPVTGTVPTEAQLFPITNGRYVSAMFRVTSADLATPVLVNGTDCTRNGSDMIVPALPGSAGALVLSVTNLNGPTPNALIPVNVGTLTKIFEQGNVDGTDATRTTLTLAMVTTTTDLAQHLVTAASSVASGASQVVAIRTAT